MEMEVHEFGAELELQQDVNTVTQQTHDTSSLMVLKNCNLQEDSSEEDDTVPEAIPLGGNRDCVCCVCGKKFSFLSILIKHFNVHKEEVRCQLCQMTFIRVISLAIHLETAHRKNHLYCKSCKLSFFNTWHMNHHMKKHFENMQIVEAKKTPEPAKQSLKRKTLEEDVEEVIIENEEVEIKYLKEEEEEEDMLRKMQETKESSVTRTTEEHQTLDAVMNDHHYCLTKSLINPDVSGEASAYTCSSVKDTDNVENVSSKKLHVFNDKQNTKNLQSDADHLRQKKFKIVVRHPLTQGEGVSSACKAILQAAYEKVAKSQNTATTPVQGTTNEFSLSSSTSEVLDPVQLQFSIKVEDNSEDHFLKCAPIEENIVKEEDEENIPIKEERDSSLLDDSAHSAEDNPISDTDSAPSMASYYSSDASENGKQTFLKSRRNLQRQTSTNTEENPFESVKESAGLQPHLTNENPLSSVKVTVCPKTGSSNENPQNAVKVNAGPVFSSSNEDPFSFAKVNVAPKPSSAGECQICSSCGLSKVPSIGKLTEYCKCTPLLMCNMCGLVCGSDELLLKHQAENHPSTKYICSRCFQVYPNQASFTKHHCCNISTVPHGQILTPVNIAQNAKSPPKMILHLVQPRNAGSQNVPSSNIRCSTNVINIVNKSQKVSTTCNSTSVLPKTPSTSQRVSKKVSAPLTINGVQEVLNKVFIVGQDPVTSAATQAKTGQMQVLIPASSPSNKKQTKMVFQNIVLPEQSQVLAADSVHVPGVKEAPSKFLKVVQDPVTSTAIQAKTGQVQVLIPASSPSNMKQTEMVFQSVVLSEQSQVLGADSVCVPGVQEAVIKFLKAVQDPVTTGATATQAKTGQVQLLIPASSPSNMKQTKLLFQNIVLPENSPVLGVDSVQGAPSKFLKVVQDPVTTGATATQAKTGHVQLLVPTSSPSNVKQTKFHFQNIVLPEQSKVLGADSVCVPGARVVPSTFLKVGQDPVTTGATATQSKTGQVQVLIPTSSSSSMKPAKMVFQNIILPEQSQVLGADSVNVHGVQEVPSKFLKVGKDSVVTGATATQSKTGQVRLLVPTSSPSSKKQTKMVFQSVVLPEQSPGLGRDPVDVPDCTSSGLSLSGTSKPNLSKILRIPTKPSTSSKVSVSFSPTTVQFPPPTFVKSRLILPKDQTLLGNVRADTVLLPEPAPVSSTTPTLDHLAAPVQTGFNLLDSFSSSSSAQDPPSSPGPLRIVAMFVNQSQELALQKRLKQGWRSKTTYPCRHCGAIARQPALSVRHRYQHRGPRLHRCQCGRTFQRLLHLLRHQVQHAETMRYVCATCGETFQSTRQLACHKQTLPFRVLPSNSNKTRQVCRNVFECVCGKAFVRSSALLWHMLLNSKSSKRLKKSSRRQLLNA